MRARAAVSQAGYQLALHGITQQQLAAEMQRDQKVVSRILAGTKPLRPDFVDALTRLVGSTAADAVIAQIPVRERAEMAAA